MSDLESLNFDNVSRSGVYSLPFLLEKTDIEYVQIASPNHKTLAGVLPGKSIEYDKDFRYRSYIYIDGLSSAEVEEILKDVYDYKSNTAFVLISPYYSLDDFNSFLRFAQKIDTRDTIKTIKRDFIKFICHLNEDFTIECDPYYIESIFLIGWNDANIGNSKILDGRSTKSMDPCNSYRNSLPVLHFTIPMRFYMEDETTLVFEPKEHINFMVDRPYLQNTMYESRVFFDALNKIWPTTRTFSFGLLGYLGPQSAIENKDTFDDDFTKAKNPKFILNWSKSDDYTVLNRAIYELTDFKIEKGRYIFKLKEKRESIFQDPLLHHDNMEFDHHHSILPIQNLRLVKIDDDDLKKDEHGKIVGKLPQKFSILDTNLRVNLEYPPIGVELSGFATINIGFSVLAGGLIIAGVLGGGITAGLICGAGNCH